MNIPKAKFDKKHFEMATKFVRSFKSSEEWREHVNARHSEEQRVFDQKMAKMERDCNIVIVAIVVICVIIGALVRMA